MNDISKKRLTALGAAFGIATGLWIGTNTVKIDDEYTGTVTDYGISFKTDVRELADGPAVSINTNLNSVIVDGEKSFRLKNPISMDRGQDSRFFLMLESHDWQDVSNDDPVEKGDRVRIEYNATFWQFAKNYLQERKILNPDDPPPLNVTRLDVLSR